MAQFQYTGRDIKGAPVTGTLDAASRDAVAGELMRRGVTPVAISEATVGGNLAIDLGSIELFKKGVTLDELIIFCRQMFALTKAGIPIIRAMRGLADSTKSKALSQTLTDVTDRLESGINLATCMQAHKEVFSDLFVSMIHVGENTGQLEQAFEQLAKSLELERDTRRRIKQATRYPMIVVIALVSALMVVNFFVIPKFASVFKKLGADLPWPTQVLVGTSDFLIAYWWLVFGLVFLLGVVFKQWVNTDNGRVKWDEKKLRFPLIGSIFELIALSRFSRNFAMMLRAGMPITQALAVTSEAVHNRYIGEHVLAMKTGIERGDSLLRTATASGMFTPLVLQMISVGEETGAVDSLLENVADFYDEEVDYELKRLAESIEPILIFAMGILVLILALGVFLPIWDLGRAALGK